MQLEAALLQQGADGLGVLQFLGTRNLLEVLVRVIALELGYAELSSRSESFSRKDMSFQAVCVGYMLCKKYGVDTKSFAVDRVPAEWKDKEPKDVRVELSKVRTAMSDIHSRISDELYRQQQERTADRAR